MSLLPIYNVCKRHSKAAASYLYSKSSEFDHEWHDSSETGLAVTEVAYLLPHMGCRQP